MFLTIVKPAIPHAENLKFTHSISSFELITKIFFLTLIVEIALDSKTWVHGMFINRYILLKVFYILHCGYFYT